jgi:hypothetical protein
LRRWLESARRSVGAKSLDDTQSIQAALAGSWIFVLGLVHNVLADIAATAAFLLYAGYCQRASRQWAAEGDPPDDDGSSGEPIGQ